MSNNILNLTQKELLAVPVFPWDTEILTKGIILLPVRKLHDSGYSLFSLVAYVPNGIIGRTPACSDVLHIEGIGGYGLNNPDFTKLPAVTAWSIDVLPKSKCISLWCAKNIIIYHALSSISIYSTDRKLES